VRPSSAPIPQSKRSLSGRTLKFGFKVLSQSRLEWNTARLILMFTDFAHYKTSRFKDVFILYLLLIGFSAYAEGALSKNYNQGRA